MSMKALMAVVLEAHGQVLAPCLPTKPTFQFRYLSGVK